LEEVVLQRGRVYSVWVVPGASGPEARLEEANVATMP
jgi:alginate O-acetyltransferase complex protein AlgF